MNLDHPLIEYCASPQAHAVGSLNVRRCLPVVQRRSVGPFVFIDHMGPTLAQESAVHIPPHPHIGIATVTYLFEGALQHQDSLGTDQRITPGAINWMTAGRGLVHSERSPTPRLDGLHGMQFWAALRKEDEESEPSFRHYPENLLPVVHSNGCRLRVAVGACFKRSSPVRTNSPTFLVEFNQETPGHVSLETVEYQERALYLIKGRVRIGTTLFEAPQLIVFRPGTTIVVEPEQTCHGVFFGGERLVERRHMYWNFVSSNKSRIEKAKDDYRKGNLGALPHEGPNLPLPDDMR